LPKKVHKYGTNLVDCRSAHDAYASLNGPIKTVEVIAGIIAAGNLKWDCEGREGEGREKSVFILSLLSASRRS